MTSSITSFGCSFAWGTDLADHRDDDKIGGYSHLTWPALTAKSLDMRYQCYAMGGLGNLAIANRVFSWFQKFTNDFFIINWTFIDRFDYGDPLNSAFMHGTNGLSTCLPGNDDEISEFYFRHLNSEYRDKLTSLMYIKTTIDYLLMKKVRFLMTAIDDLLWCQQWHAPGFVKDFQQEIRPYIHDFEGRNFLAWSRHRGFPISDTGHPLEEAHAAAAELMLPKIQDLLNNKKSLS